MTKQFLQKTLVISSFFLASLAASSVQAAEDIEELLAKAEKVQSAIDKSSAQKQELAEKMEQVQNKYQKELSSVEAQGAAIYDEKIKSVQQKKEQTAASKTQIQENENKASKTQSEKAEKKAVSYPLERNPRYVAPSKSNKPQGRRPFTRSDNEYNGKTIYYAVRQNQEEMFFAKEAVQAYTGTTPENVFVFSDNLANYCKMDTTTLDKTSECLETIINQRSQGSQTIKEQMNDLHQESLIDTTSHAIADAARYKNDTSGYEKNVLIPLQEKSSKATDERGDIEVLTLTEMEALKLKNKLIQVYANQLALDSFRDFGTFEVNNRDLTNIDNK